MDRRDFFKARQIATITSPQPFRTNAGLNPYTGPWTSNEVIHLLKRTMFGAKPEDVSFFKAMTMSQAVDTLLTVPAVPPAPPIKNYDNTNIPPADPDTTVSQGNTWVNVNSYDGDVNFRRRQSFKSWWTGLMINQDRNILEKMTLFWHNHFATQSDDIDVGIWIYRHNAMLRSNALGNFKSFVRQVTLDVAMLRYLNGYLNIASAPDENYARELQELFTLGKENNPNYTEADVMSAARVLTGWTINANTNAAAFGAGRHDVQNKQFSSFYNNTVITGRTGATAGNLELDDLMNMIFTKQNEVSRFIARKLYRFFVYYKIDQATETNVIEPLAQIFRNTNWEIKPMIEALLKSEHFYDAVNKGCLIKPPVDMVVGLCREYGVAFPAASDYVNAYNMWNFIYSYSALLQQNLGDPPDVAGWKAYYQEPQFHEIWINTDTYPKRNILTDVLIYTGYSRNGKRLIIDPVEFAKKLSNPADPNVLIQDSLDILYRIDLTAATKDALKKQILLTNQDQDYYWTNAWNAYISNPVPANYQVVYTRLRDLYKYFMNLAEYQLS